jgi:hypothetical protein
VTGWKALNANDREDELELEAFVCGMCLTAKGRFLYKTNQSEPKIEKMVISDLEAKYSKIYYFIDLDLGKY